MRPNANLEFTVTTRMEPLTLISIDPQIASALPLAP